MTHPTEHTAIHAMIATLAARVERLERLVPAVVTCRRCKSQFEPSEESEVCPHDLLPQRPETVR